MRVTNGKTISRLSKLVSETRSPVGSREYIGSEFMAVKAFQMRKNHWQVRIARLISGPTKIPNRGRTATANTAPFSIRRYGELVVKRSTFP